MSNKRVENIMFYDEAQKAWVVDRVEVENNDQDAMNQNIMQENQSKQERSYV
jgi:hypothetical protein